MAIDQNDLKNLQKFVEEISLTDFAEQGLDETSDLFENGVLDSYGFIEVVTYIETEFGVKFLEEDFLDKRFTTTAGTLEMMAIARSRSGETPAAALEQFNET